MTDMNRNVWEGWTPQDFINELESSLDVIMEGKSWQKKFENKKDMVEWIKSNQPYNKKSIPEVNNYFAKKYNLK